LKKLERRRLTLKMDLLDSHATLRRSDDGVPLKKPVKQQPPQPAALKKKSQRPLGPDFDHLPPVQLRHQVIDMGSFALFVTFMLVPVTCFKFIAHRSDDFVFMMVVSTTFVFVQYWIIAGYFMICEALGLCHDMFVVDPKKRITFWQGAPQVLLNQTAGSIYSVTMWYLIASYRDWTDFTTMPSAWEIVKYQTCLALFWSELWMYATHRLLHQPFLFAFHKMHHEQNNVSLTVAWGARYCSTFEDIFSNVSAISIFAFWHSAHPAFVMSWVAHAQWNVVCNHTGYHEKYLPFTAMMTGMIHHNHHANGQSDFGTTVGWADWLFNTKGSNHPGSVVATLLDGIWVAFGGKSKL